MKQEKKILNILLNDVTSHQILVRNLGFSNLKRTQVV